MIRVLVCYLTITCSIAVAEQQDAVGPVSSVVGTKDVGGGAVVGLLGPPQMTAATSTLASTHAASELQFSLTTTAATVTTSATAQLMPGNETTSVPPQLVHASNSTRNSSEANATNASNESNSPLSESDVSDELLEEEAEEAINETYEKFEEMAHQIAMLFAASFMLACVVGNLMHICHITFIPESLIIIVIGMLLGFTEVEIPDVVLTMREETLYNKLVLNLVLLPIIIFEAGWSMRHKDFVAQLGYILVFAIFGTIICMMVVASLTVWTCQWHGICHYRVAYAYGALISAVDPVATLATYAHLNVDPLLNILVLGESIINDAVAIVLFSVLNDKPASFFHEHSHSEIAWSIALGVLKLLGGSVGLGLGLGAVYVCVIRITRLAHSASLAILFIFTCCFFSYTFAEVVCGLSGIITVLFQGMIMSSYLTPHLTIEGRLLTSFLLKQMASLGDMAVFLFVGVAVVYASVSGLVTGAFIMVFCLAGRAVATVPLALLCNLIKARKKTPPELQTNISWRHIFMMWHAGLRGGIALVLALDLGVWVDELNGPGTREVLRNATLLVIVVFLLVFGGTTEMALKCMGIPMGDPPPMPIRDSSFRRVLMSLSRSAFKPVLVGKKEVEDNLPGGIVKQILEEAELKRSKRKARNQTSGSSSPSIVPDQPQGAAYDLFGETDPQRTRNWMDVGDDSHMDGADMEEDYGGYSTTEEDVPGSLMSTPLY